MPTCQSCEREWTWQQTFKKQFNLIGKMSCPYCGEKQYYSARFRKQSTIIPFALISFIMLGNLLFGPTIIAVVALLGLLPIFFVVTPFFIELANEEEPLF